MKNKRRNGAQPEMKFLFRGHGGFPIKQKGEAASLSFALERHLWRPRSIACYNVLCLCILREITPLSLAWLPSKAGSQRICGCPACQDYTSRL